MNNLKYLKSHLCAVLTIFIKSPYKSFLKSYMPDYKLDSIPRNVLVFNKKNNTFSLWEMRLLVAEMAVVC